MKRVAILVAAIAFTLSINIKVYATGVGNLNNTEVNQTTVTETTQGSTTNEAEKVVDNTSTDTNIDEAINKDTGIMPDSIFYFFDKAFDNFRLFLTFDDEKKIEILSEIANERLLESETMTKEEKYELAMSAIEEFNNLVTEAADLIEEPAIEEPAIEEPTIEEPEIDKSEIKLAKKAAVANMVEKRHELNKARQEYQSTIVDLKKVIKSGDEEAIIAAEELLKEKQGSYKDTVEAFKIAFKEMKDTRNYNKKSDAKVEEDNKEEVKVDEVKVDEDKVEVADEEKIEEENTISNIEDEKVLEAKKVKEAKEIKEIKEMKEAKEKTEKKEKKETRNEYRKNNERTNEHKENNND